MSVCVNPVTSECHVCPCCVFAVATKVMCMCDVCAEHSSIVFIWVRCILVVCMLYSQSVRLASMASLSRAHECSSSLLMRGGLSLLFAHHTPDDACLTSTLIISKSNVTCACGMQGPRKLQNYRHYRGRIGILVCSYSFSGSLALSRSLSLSLSLALPLALPLSPSLARSLALLISL